MIEITASCPETLDVSPTVVERVARELAFNYMLGWIERQEDAASVVEHRDRNIQRASKRAERGFDVFMGVASNLLNQPEGDNIRWQTARFQPTQTCP